MKQKQGQHVHSLTKRKRFVASFQAIEHTQDVKEIDIERKSKFSIIYSESAALLTIVNDASETYNLNIKMVKEANNSPFNNIGNNDSDGKSLDISIQRKNNKK